jgi:hypothetical protein
MVVDVAELNGRDLALDPCRACGATGVCEHLIAVRFDGDSTPCAFRLFVSRDEAERRVARIAAAAADAGAGVN